MPNSASSKVPSKRHRPAVQVVECPSAFPLSNKPKKTPVDDNSQTTIPYLDFGATSLEIRRFGGKGLDTKKRKSYADEEYERLTGRKRKQNKTPLPILRGMKRKAKEREEKRAKEEREAGIVSASTVHQNKKHTRSKDARVHGPAPSVGFVAKGILRVNPKKR